MGLTTITFFEHQKIDYKDLGIDNTHRLLADIEKLNEQAGVELISVGRNYLKASQYVGIIRAGNFLLQVLPKIDYPTKNEKLVETTTSNSNFAEKTAAINLLYLLSYTHNLPVKAIERAALGSQVGNWFDLLTRLFVEDLHSLMGGGLSRAYVTQEENLPMLRGRWEVEKQLRRQPHLRHRFDTRYDEYSPDTELNRVFRFVCNRLLALTVDPYNQILLIDLIEWFRQVTYLETVGAVQLDRITFTRLNDHFRPSFNLARLFLELGVLKFQEGVTQAFAFVFDMNQLFERFIAGFIERHRKLVLPLPWMDYQVIAQSRGQTQYLAERDKNHQLIFQLQPDVIIARFPKKPDLILDTKYKILDPKSRSLGVSESDLYQMLAYITRLNCTSVVLLYPRNLGNLPTKESFHILDSEARIFVADISLNRPINDFRPIAEDLRNTLLMVLHHGR